MTLPDSAAHAAPRLVRGRLFVLMLLQYFIWGSWLPLIYGYLPSLGFTLQQQALVLNAFPVSALVGMFAIGRWLGRRRCPNRFLAICHLMGGGAILICAFTTEFVPFFAGMLGHCLFFVPTLSVANSMALSHLEAPERQFGLVRSGGAVGWMLAAWPLSILLVDWSAVAATRPSSAIDWLVRGFAYPLAGDAVQAATRGAFLVAGAGSLLLAAFCLTLPTGGRIREEVGADGPGGGWFAGFGLLSRPRFLVLWVTAFVVAFVHRCYFNWTAVFLVTPREALGAGLAANWVLPVMGIAQASEILALFAFRPILNRLGWKVALATGVGTYGLRFALYALFPDSLTAIVAVQALHGISYVLFFITLYVFVGRQCPFDQSANAQGLFNFQIHGTAALCANTVCPWLLQRVFNDGATVNFTGLFLVPCVAALAAALLVIFFFDATPVRPTTDDGS